jgi:uncharacterized repeat protein (TIGR02543 family)
LPAAPSRTNYTFDGWNTASNGSGTAFTGATTVSKSITVYAKWKASTPTPAAAYTVTFNNNGGTTQANPTSKTVTSPATTVGTLPAAPSRTNYTFDGWNTAANGSGTAFAGNTAVSKNITVYAKWKAATPVVTPAKPRTRAENQQLIQSRCKFSNANDVWAAINKHQYADSLYDQWAKSYPTGLVSTKPKTLDTNGYKAYIQTQCKFSNPNDVWKVIEQNHKFASDLFKVWATSYYTKR